MERKDERCRAVFPRRQEIEARHPLREIVAYFYDKSGKQLEVASGSSGKPRQHQDCTGNIFGGVMKPGEKAVLTFSCLSKSHVPEGTTAIEAEMRMVGFADATTIIHED